jgi:hypothetical protein
MAGQALEIPQQWALHQLTMYFEEDLRGEAKPFAGNVVLVLRFDADPGTSLEKMREKDLVMLRKMGTPIEVIAHGKMELAGATIEHLEWASDDPRLGILRHLALYLSKGPHVYTATGTHIGDRFDVIRPQFMEFVRAFLHGQKE